MIQIIRYFWGREVTYTAHKTGAVYQSRQRVSTDSYLFKTGLELSSFCSVPLRSFVHYLFLLETFPSYVHISPPFPYYVRKEVTSGLEDKSGRTATKSTEVFSLVIVQPFRRTLNWIFGMQFHYNFR
jgi:hypothetical protein